MVLIKYPHQLLERRGEKERSNRIKGIKEVENHGKNERGREGRERKRERKKDSYFRFQNGSHVGDNLTL